MRRLLNVRLIDLVALALSCLGVAFIGYTIIRGGWY